MAYGYRDDDSFFLKIRAAFRGVPPRKYRMNRKKAAPEGGLISATLKAARFTSRPWP